ncbi:hypothetical protein LFL96_25975 [Paraburkholderia sp. D15]|uniref:hypothetical protein n=1 Tax=Paraburkholderia sp. D15 TaxID=2880218 RepID=UPI00247840F8|nr:hypothetical protein [Paraburkholderia sp. D15]WGS54465.1 hypothetical protein LFL96_25975 [Paraburkholderia sp. D15]
MEFFSALLMYLLLAAVFYIAGTLISWERIWNTILDLIGYVIEGAEKAADGMKRIFS